MAKCDPALLRKWKLIISFRLRHNFIKSLDSRLIFNGLEWRARWCQQLWARVQGGVRLKGGGLALHLKKPITRGLRTPRSSGVLLYSHGGFGFACEIWIFREMCTQLCLLLWIACEL